MTTHQPAILPATLPAGTRSIFGNVATGELLFRAASGMYTGVFDNSERPLSYRASSIDWSSIPEPAEAPKLCAACGTNITDRHPAAVMHGSSLHRLGVPVDTIVCYDCCRPNLAEKCAADIARRAAQAAPDRPIQAGDWVECVDASGREQLTVGELYQVERVRESSDPRRPQFDLLGVDSPAFGLCASRFKTSGGVCVEQSAAPAVPDTGLLRDEFCPECATPLTHANVGNMPLCRGCTERRGAAAPVATVGECADCGAPGKVDPASGLCRYCDYSTDEGKVDRVGRDEFARCATDTNPRRDKKATERLAAMARAERPRGNPAQRKQMEQGHPSGWPSIGDDEP